MGCGVAKERKKEREGERDRKEREKERRGKREREFHLEKTSDESSHPFKARRRFRAASFPIQGRIVLLKIRVGARRECQISNTFYVEADDDSSGPQRQHSRQHY